MKRWKMLLLLCCAVLLAGCGPHKQSIPGAPNPGDAKRAPGQLPGDETIKNPEVAYNMALEFAGQRNMEAAHHYIDLASSMQPQSKYSFTKALLYLSESKFQEALTYLDLALQQNPGTEENRLAVLNAKGVCLMQLNRDDEALAIFREVVNTPGLYSRFEPYYNMGVIYLRQNKFLDAEAVFIKVVEENPRYYKAYNKLGILAANKGKWGDAAVYFKRALDIMSGDYAATQSDGAELYFHYGEALFQEKHYPEARNALMEVLKLAPESRFGTSAKAILSQIGGAE